MSNFRLTIYSLFALLMTAQPVSAANPLHDVKVPPSYSGKRPLTTDEAGIFRNAYDAVKTIRTKSELLLKHRDVKLKLLEKDLDVKACDAAKSIATHVMHTKIPKLPGTTIQIPVKQNEEDTKGHIELENLKKKFAGKDVLALSTYVQADEFSDTNEDADDCVTKWLQADIKSPKNDIHRLFDDKMENFCLRTTEVAPKGAEEKKGVLCTVVAVFPGDGKTEDPEEPETKPDGTPIDPNLPAAPPLAGDAKRKPAATNIDGTNPNTEGPASQPRDPGRARGEEPANPGGQQTKPYMTEQERAMQEALSSPPFSPARFAYLQDSVIAAGENSPLTPIQRPDRNVPAFLADKLADGGNQLCVKIGDGEFYLPLSFNAADPTQLAATDGQQVPPEAEMIAFQYYNWALQQNPAVLNAQETQQVMPFVERMRGGGGGSPDGLGPEFGGNGNPLLGQGGFGAAGQRPFTGQPPMDIGDGGKLYFPPPKVPLTQENGFSLSDVNGQPLEGGGAAGAAYRPNPGASPEGRIDPGAGEGFPGIDAFSPQRVP